MPLRQGVEPGERAQRGGLARAVRPQQRDGLPGADAQRQIEPEGSALGDEPSVQEPSHGAAVQRSRRHARTVTETASRMRLSTIAASRSVSSAR